jgi:hypothetical protein
MLKNDNRNRKKKMRPDTNGSNWESFSIKDFKTNKNRMYSLFYRDEDCYSDLIKIPENFI